MPTCASNQRNDRIRKKTRNKKTLFRAQRRRQGGCRGLGCLRQFCRRPCNQAPCLGLMAIFEAFAILGSAKLTRLRDRALHRACFELFFFFAFFLFFHRSCQPAAACEAEKSCLWKLGQSQLAHFVVRRLRPSQTKVNANFGWVSKSVISLVRFNEESSPTFFSNKLLSLWIQLLPTDPKFRPIASSVIRLVGKSIKRSFEKETVETLNYINLQYAVKIMGLNEVMGLGNFRSQIKYSNIF